MAIALSFKWVITSGQIYVFLLKKDKIKNQGFIWIWGFMLAKQVIYHLRHTSSLFFSGYFADGGLKNYLPCLASNHNPFYFSLPNS
jgi:hypothetical protein